MSERSPESNGEPQSPSSPAASPLSSRTPRSTATLAKQAVISLRQAPLLGLIATLAGLTEFLIARLTRHALELVDATEHVSNVLKVGVLPRNLAAIAGIVALVTSLFDFLRHSGYGSIPRRLTIAALAGIYVPGIAIATVIPAASMSHRLIILSLASANLITVLFCLTGVRYRSPSPLRAAVACVAISSGLTLMTGIFAILAHPVVEGRTGLLTNYVMAHPEFSRQFIEGTLLVSEIIWMLPCIAVAYTLALSPSVSKRIWRLAIAFTLTTAIGFILLHHAATHEFRLMLYAIFRLGTWSDSHPLLCIVPIAVGLGAGLAGLLRAPPSRQAALSLILWVIAGFAPQTPIQLLYMLLGAVMLTRACQAMDPNGAWTERRPWSVGRPRQDSRDEQATDER